MAQTFIVKSGTTSVSLDLPLLELAAGITLVSANTDGEAFSSEFQLGFPIVEDTDFTFETEPFTPVDGTIKHSGTVNLNLNDAPVTVGDFSLGFDASRVSDTASGFVVSDTTEDALGLEILFDISAPGNVTTEGGLTISEADLLVAPELAGALGSDSLTGADVGDVRIDASTDNILEDSDQTIELFRFRNTSFESGTYVFVGEEERDAILADEDLSNTFALDGEQEDGSVNPAFKASLVPGDDLIPFYRLKSLDVPGTFLFVSTDEYDAIFAEDSDQQDKWEKEGLDGEGEDIAEFHLLDGSADRGIEFNRFQNTQNNTFLYAGPDETQAIESDPNLSNLFTNQGVAFESLD